MHQLRISNELFPAHLIQEYCKDNHIVIPDFRLDEQGFMIHPVTGKRFSPYEKEVLL